ncbi:MAG: HEAT repeat domain-containing protein [Pseudobdellovibrionaceae bacterium]
MNVKSLISFLLLVFSFQVFAVGSKTSTSTLISTIEVLKLPSENRKIVLHTQGEKHYQNFIKVAFSEAQPMSLRWRALTAAAQVRGAESSHDLLKASSHSQWYMRNAALVALYEVNPKEGIKLARKLLKDKALVVRSAAVDVLEKNLSPEIRDLLWEELNQKYNFKNTESLWIRQQIVGSLAKKPLNREGRLFIQLLSDKDPEVQLPAVRGLEKLTGVKLGKGELKQSALVGLWKDYIKKEKIEL